MSHASKFPSTQHPACPHCKGGPSRVLGLGLVATALEREVGHEPDCPSSPAQRLGRLVSVLVIAVTPTIALPACTAGAAGQAQGLDNGTVGRAELPGSPSIVDDAA
ncbi:MAG: hypothetical protein P1V81_05725 [Planctomycetota bacterium]|nr:hypothetical protein [Planctomycetota bacterium]